MCGALGRRRPARPIPPGLDMFLLLLLGVHGTSAVLHCLAAREKCLEDPACAVLLDVIAKTCRDTYDGTICRANGLDTCQGALRAAWNNDIFEGACLCSDQPVDEECRQLRDSLSDHPCSHVPRPDPSTGGDLATWPTCTYAYGLCYRNGKCKKIYDYFRRMCKVKEGECGMHSRVKCRRAFTKVQLTPVYGCLCHGEDDLEKCANIYTLINRNPCVDALYWPPGGEGSSAFVPGLEMTTQGLELSLWANQTDTPESQLFSPVVSALHGEVVGLHGVRTHPNMVFSLPTKGNGRESPVTGPPPDSSTAIKAKSTCQRAYHFCEEDMGCRVLLGNMLQACEATAALCNRTECMYFVRDFYHLGNPATTRAVALCICRYNDDACLEQQRKLHPPCAQRPEVEMPACHEVAEQCRASADCRPRMERFVEACAVDRGTLQCQGPLEECRLALIDILGTPLRTNCACAGNDFALLYYCIEWQRMVWLNPCVVQAQKDYHENRQPTNVPAPGATPGRDPAPPPSVNSNQRALHSTASSPSTSGPIPQSEESTLAPSYPEFHYTSTPDNTEYCKVPSEDDEDIPIAVGQGQRIYDRVDPDCSMICICMVGRELDCKHLDCPEKTACQTSMAVYRHNFRTYKAFRGHCICYSGNFICEKPPEGNYELNPGVYLFLGYSKFEEETIRKHTNFTLSTVVNFLQRMIFNYQTSPCKLAVYRTLEENLIIQAYLEEFDEERENNSITADMVRREDVTCSFYLRNLTLFINKGDVSIRNHMALSVLKLAAVEVHVKPYLSAGAPFALSSALVFGALALALGARPPPP